MITKKKKEILKAVRYLCLLCVIVLGLVSIVGTADTGTPGSSGSSRRCKSGNCENKWMSDGHVMCCSKDYKYGRRENSKCYQTFADAYVGTSYSVTVPGSRECY